MTTSDQFKIRKIGNVTHKTKLKCKFKMIKKYQNYQKIIAMNMNMTSDQFKTKLRNVTELKKLQMNFSCCRYSSTHGSSQMYVKKT